VKSVVSYVSCLKVSTDISFITVKNLEQVVCDYANITSAEEMVLNQTAMVEDANSSYEYYKLTKN